MITEVSNICSSNISGLSNISLINTEAIERFNLFSINNQIRIDLRIKEEYLDTKKFQVNFKVGVNTATYSQALQATPSGPLYNQSLLLKAQSINKVFQEAIKAELKLNSKHILYLVLKNGFTYMVGSLDNPIQVRSIFQETSIADIQVSLSGQTPDPGVLIFSQSVPHFFKTRSHAFENDFYNFE